MQLEETFTHKVYPCLFYGDVKNLLLLIYQPIEVSLLEEPAKQYLLFTIVLPYATP